jgi:hypothetical protein
MSMEGHTGGPNGSLTILAFGRRRAAEVLGWVKLNVRVWLPLPEHVAVAVKLFVILNVENKGPALLLVSNPATTDATRVP